MTDTAGSFPWTDDQWSRARKVVQENARRARVASSFLPLFGPLPAEQVTVSTQVMSTVDNVNGSAGEAPQRLQIDTGNVMPLTTIAADVYLRNSDLADPDMSSALAMIGRAADLLGRVEDSIVFNGQNDHELVEPVLPMIYTVSGGQASPGLLTHEGVPRVTIDAASAVDYPSALVAATVRAIGELERSGFHGPFALALGNDLYLDANSPNQNSMVLASDRILPFLNGPLVRSGAIPAGEGVLVSLAAEPVDLVVATDLELKYIQTTLEPRAVLRLRERFALRIKQHEALRVLVRSGAA